MPGPGEVEAFPRASGFRPGMEVMGKRRGGPPTPAARVPAREGPLRGALWGGLEEMDQRDPDSWDERPDPQDGEPEEFRPFLSDEFDLQEAMVEKSLRPRRFEDFVGQRRVVENLRTAINAARARGEVLEHVLLSGMP